MKHCGRCGALLQEETGRLRCPDCSWTWYNPPTPVTLVLVTTDDGRVVYTRKNSFESWRWTVVAGFIERGERAEDAAVREVKEETGLDSEIVKFMGTHVYERNPDQLVVTFHVRVTGGTPQAGDDVDQIDIAPPDPSRLRQGATSWWLVKQYEQELLAQRQQQQQQ
jgi:NADH pyrophosphatase NudC (nudix superfamily)